MGNNSYDRGETTMKLYNVTLAVLFVMFASMLIITQEIGADELPVYAENVVYNSAGDGVGYLARPAKEGVYPGLVLIHEWWGLNDNIREIAEDFAELGYVALAVDLYNGQTASTPDEARKLATGVRNNLPEAFENLGSAVAFLQNSSYVAQNRLASVGWCFGGGWSYEMARNDMGVRASVMYYGRFSPDDDFSNMRALILGNFGEDDRAISVDSVREFQATLKTLNGAHEIYIYPNAGHAFANSDSSNYNAEAAELAWERTLSFLHKHL
jgi:carboxymethylenebutenolidase